MAFHKSEPPHEESWVICIPGTLFFCMIIFGAIVYISNKSWLALSIAIVGAVLIRLFYW